MPWQRVVTGSILSTYAEVFIYRRRVSLCVKSAGVMHSPKLFSVIALLSEWVFSLQVICKHTLWGALETFSHTFRILEFFFVSTKVLEVFIQNLLVQRNVTVTMGYSSKLIAVTSSTVRFSYCLNIFLTLFFQLLALINLKTYICQHIYPKSRARNDF